jgi:hypothetical protein
MKPRSALAGLLIVCAATCAAAQETPPEDNRTQYPAFMVNSYFTINLGSIRYIFSGDQLAPGYQADTIGIPHLAARVDLFGHHFTKHLAAQVTYMRPARYVVYHSINGDGIDRQVSMAYGGLTLVWDAPLGSRMSAYGEGGYGVTSRSGFEIDGKTVLEPAHFGAGLLGAGLAYHASPNVDIMFGATYSPGRKSFAQPSTRLFTTGLRYHMRELPADVAGNHGDGYVFPLNIIRLGYTTNLLGYGVNNFFSQRVPIFWGGDVDTRRGFTLDYQRNVFHTRKVFAFDLGASASYWKSDGDRQIFRTLSAYPLLRFFLARTERADMYLGYSLAGPTFIAQAVVDGRSTGQRFTFQDFMSFGGFFGKARRFNGEIGVKHYSNGNLFTTNPGIKVPITLTLGLVF